MGKARRPNQDNWEAIWDRVNSDRLHEHAYAELKKIIAWAMESYDVSFSLRVAIGEHAKWRITKKGVGFIEGDNSGNHPLISIRKKGLSGKCIMQYKTTFYGLGLHHENGQVLRLEAEIIELFAGPPRGITPIPFTKGFGIHVGFDSVWLCNTSQLGSVTVRGIVAIDSNGALSGRIEDPNSKPWFHIQAQNNRQQEFFILTDGKVILPASEKNVLNNKTPKNNVDLTRVNHIDKQLVNAAIKRWLEEDAASVNASETAYE